MNTIADQTVIIGSSRPKSNTASMNRAHAA